MKISVVIPAYNCESTIRSALDSVFAQTRRPDEVIVMDDGSTDQTASLLNSYRPRITVLSQRNGGVTSARNALCARAQGDLIAFIDSDDIWHPRYLETQLEIFQVYPQAVAYFTGHVNFVGARDYQWTVDPFRESATIEVIPPLKFLKRYNAEPGPFMCISHCCVPKQVFRTLGDEPFKLRMAEDLYFFNLAAPLGPILFLPKPMVAYRIREGSLSSDRLKLTEAEVQAFELLEDRYRKSTDSLLTKVYREAFASKRRLYAKVLLGAGMISEARVQLWNSLFLAGNPASMAKSLGLLFLSCLPRPLQPTWPPMHRVFNTAEETAPLKATRRQENV